MNTGLASILDSLHRELVVLGYRWREPEVSNDGRVATWLYGTRGLQVECFRSWNVTGLVYTLHLWRRIEGGKMWTTSETSAAVLWDWMHSAGWVEAVG